MQEITSIAEARDYAPAQVALAVSLDKGDLDRLATLADKVAGARYDERGMSIVDADTTALG